MFILGNSLVRIGAVTLLALVVLCSEYVLAKDKGRFVALRPGQVRVLDVKSVEKVAIGNDNIVNYRISENDELVLIGVAAGETTLHLWRKGNRQEFLHVRVSNGNVSRSLKAAKRLVQSMKDITVSRVDDYIVFEGKVAESRYETLENIVEATPGGVMLAEATNFDQQPLIRIDVQMLDINKSDLKDIGIRWNDTIAGPAGYLTGNVIRSSRLGVATEDPNGLFDDDALALFSPNDKRFYGYLGITTSITSQISLIEETGAGSVIASPKLVAASGQEAEFNVGGEFPIPTINALGGTDVQFQDYGIELVITPTANDEDIWVEVYAEISTIDFAVAISGVPGIQTRDTKTIVNLRSGETLAISGLASITDSKSVDKVPVLGDLPLIKPFFRATNQREEGREVIALITPRIITPGDAYDKPLQDIAEEHLKPFKGYKNIADALME